MSKLDSSKPPCSIDGCNCEVYCRGWCSTHYNRWRRHGTPYKTIHAPRGLSLLEKFWRRVDQDTTPDDCWEWSGARDRKGYGQLRHDGKLFRANRVACEIGHGPLKEDQQARHKCDNPPCCRPDHLEPGTALDNAHDAWERGRMGYRDVYVTDSQVLELRQRYTAGEKTVTLAKEYGISRTAVQAIAAGRLRSYLPGSVPDAVKARQKNRG